MSEEKKSQYTPKELKIMTGLMSQVIDLAAEGKTDETILSIAKKVKESAYEKLNPEEADNKLYLTSCDRVVKLIEESDDPAKTILKFFKENR